MEKNEKVALVGTLQEKLSKAHIAVCADFRGFTVADATTFRRELRAAGAEAVVIKNTLAKLACKQSSMVSGDSGELDKFLGTFKGPSLVLYSLIDPVSPTKVLAKYASPPLGKIKIKGAMLDGRFLDAAGVEAVSRLPGREELLSQLLRLMQTPATKLVRLLSAPSTRVVRVLNAQKEKLAEVA